MKPSTTASAPQNPDLEIKDAQLIFNRVWKELEEEIGRENLRFPKELILLGGAPGSGKGTNTAFICEVRGISAPPIVISQLLDSPEARKIKANGGVQTRQSQRQMMVRLAWPRIIQEMLEPLLSGGCSS